MPALAARAEDTLAALAAIGVAVLPLAEVVLRRIAGIDLIGTGPLGEHLTLLVGLLGGAIAAREGKLLSLATGAFLPEGRARAIAEVFSAMVGSLVAAILAIGGFDLLRIHRESGRIIAGAIPIWWFDSAFPLAFGLVALRLVRRAVRAPIGRAAGLAGIAAGWWIARQADAAVLLDTPGWPWVLLLVAAAIAGMPIFALLGGCGVLLFMTLGDTPANAIIASYTQLTSSDLAAIPLFTLAGFLLAEGRASERLLRLFRAFFGWMPGGTAVVTAALCAFFTVLTGGSGVTILALGGLLLPALLKDNYRERFSMGLLTASGSLGLLFPPALPLILYGIVAGVSIQDLFIGGLGPGVIMLALVATLGIREGIASGTPRPSFAPREAAAAFWQAKWEILLPVVILGSLLVGSTTVQSSALAALYTLIVQRYVQRDLPSFAELRRVMSDCLALVGGVLIILSSAVILTSYLTFAQVPAAMIAWTESHVHSQATFLLGLNVFLLIVGCLMDIFSAIVVVVPLVVPIATRSFGVDPIHLGIVFVANLELGYLTPPVGLNLFISSYRFKKPMMEIARAVLPMLSILAVGVLLITYWPSLTLAVLRWLGRI